MVDDFVLISYASGLKKTAFLHYVGYVRRVSAESFEIQCMRRHQSSLHQFVFPTNPDIGNYKADDIIQILGKPKVSRAVHFFPDDLSAYRNTLR
jgi:hypothetical protein